MIAAIITAAGKGTRLKSNISKQFMNIYGKPILAHSINVFQNSLKIQEIYVAVPKEYMDFCRKSIIENKTAAVETAITNSIIVLFADGSFPTFFVSIP